MPSISPSGWGGESPSTTRSLLCAGCPCTSCTSFISGSFPIAISAFRHLPLDPLLARREHSGQLKASVWPLSWLAGLFILYSKL